MSNLSKRIELHNFLCEVIGCDASGSGCRCYYQPPSSIQMTYPCIIYELNDIKNEFANDNAYISNKRYTVTYVTKDPDDELVDTLAHIPTCSFDRFYTADNLNHYNYTIYY